MSKRISAADEESYWWNVKQAMFKRVGQASLKTVIKSCHCRYNNFISRLLKNILQGRYCFIQAFSECFAQNWWETLQSLVSLGIQEAITYTSCGFVEYNWDKLREIIKQYALSKKAEIHLEGDQQEVFYFPNNKYCIILTHGVDGAKTHYKCQETI